MLRQFVSLYIDIYVYIYNRVHHKSTIIALYQITKRNSMFTQHTVFFFRRGRAMQSCCWCLSRKCYISIRGKSLRVCSFPFLSFLLLFIYLFILSLLLLLFFSFLFFHLRSSLFSLSFPSQKILFLFSNIFVNFFYFCSPSLPQDKIL